MGERRNDGRKLSEHEPYPPEILKTYPQHTFITGIQRIGKYED